MNKNKKIILLGAIGFCATFIAGYSIGLGKENMNFKWSKGLVIGSGHDVTIFCKNGPKGCEDKCGECMDCDGPCVRVIAETESGKINKIEATTIGDLRDDCSDPIESVIEEYCAQLSKEQNLNCKDILKGIKSTYMDTVSEKSISKAIRGYEGGTKVIEDAGINISEIEELRDMPAISADKEFDKYWIHVTTEIDVKSKEAKNTSIILEMKLADYMDEGDPGNN